MTAVLSWDEVDQWVARQKRIGNDVRWDGWTLVFHKPTLFGFTQEVVHQGSVRKVGAFRKGRWGVESRVPVDSDGNWRVPSKNVRLPK